MPIVVIKFALLISVAISVVAILESGSIFHPVYAATYGYARGQLDATRDFHGMNNHGFDDSCPAAHSVQYCVQYKDGYSTQWAVLSNYALVNGTNYNNDNNAQSGSVGTNKIKTGDNNEENVYTNSQQANSNDNSNHNGRLSSCMACCVN